MYAFAPEKIPSLDGVAKTHQLLRCCNCSRHCGVIKVRLIPRQLRALHLALFA
jgi:hypothetical protein